MEPFFPVVLLGLAIGLLIWGVTNVSVEGRYTKLVTTSAIAVCVGVGVGLLGWFFTTSGRVGPQDVIIPGLLLVGLLVWGLINPAVGRRLARIFAVIAMGLGTGSLLWGISGAMSGERLRAPFGGALITEVSEAIGWGAGFLTGGIVALVLSFLGKTQGAGPPDSRQGSSPDGSDHTQNQG